jgi:phytoene dehydrogenase-like protein
VTNALERLGTELGTIILRDTTVTSIQDDGVHVLHTDKDEPEFLPADLVVCNADLPYATKSLLNNDRTPHEGTASGSALPTFDWDDSFNFSSGVIAFHWSIKRSCDDLNTHNFYVHRASKTDPSAAPSGCNSVMVLVPCRTLLRDEECAKMPRDEAMNKYKEQFSNEVVSRARQAVFHRLAAIDTLKHLEKDIIDEVVDTPATWADRFNVGAGAPFALSHGFAQLSLTRPGPASAPVSNVLFCGASTRPGNGVPLVLIGAKQVAKKAISALQENQQHR